MKKLIVAVAVLVSFLTWRALAVTTQPQNIGVVSMSLKNLTAAQVAQSTSTAKGEMIYCSDCTANGAAGTICLSTATAKASFILSTGTVCK